MNLINLNGLALIGPGSEWFWSALQFVIVAITLYAIYRQVRLQASQAAIAQVQALHGDWETERMTRSRLAVLVALRDGVDAAHAPVGAGNDVARFWDAVGFLAREGHIDRRIVHENFSGRVQHWWALLAEAIYFYRERTDPRVMADFEWLAALCAEKDRNTGSGVTYDATYLARSLQPDIDALLETVGTLEELRAVIVRPMSTATLATETSAE